MKKGRAAVTLALLCRLEDRVTLSEQLLRHTSALGVRAHLVEREVLERDVVWVESAYGRGRVKRAWLRGEPTSLKLSPEYEDAARLAQARGEPLALIYRALTEAALADKTSP